MEKHKIRFTEWVIMLGTVILGIIGAWLVGTLLA